MFYGSGLAITHILGMAASCSFLMRSVEPGGKFLPGIRVYVQKSDVLAVGVSFIHFSVLVLCWLTMTTLPTMTSGAEAPHYI